MKDANELQWRTLRVRISMLIILPVALSLATGCASRQAQDSLTGATAQRLVTHSIDELMSQLPSSDFEPWRGKKLWLNSKFIEQSSLKTYADHRLRIALQQDYAITFAKRIEQADAKLTVFYTSLATDRELAGFFLPLGSIPGFEEQAHINLLTLDKFHGVSELFYFIESEGVIERGPTLLSRTRSDALGLPIITIPISNFSDESISD